jgi:translation elongation factor EF-Tu-like GTPase
MRRIRAAITLHREGGRATSINPPSGTYRPHLVPDGSSSTLGVQLVDGPESIAPGESGEVTCECIFELSYDELQPGVRFVIVEGPHRIGVGVVVSGERGADSA